MSTQESTLKREPRACSFQESVSTGNISCDTRMRRRASFGLDSRHADVFAWVWLASAHLRSRASYACAYARTHACICTRPDARVHVRVRTRAWRGAGETSFMRA
eukprot:571859-Pleurochrysis_carterae.AAC.1